MKWTAIWSRFSTHRIVIYADFIDPFCYIGFHNARLAAAAQKVDLDWRGFELNPDTPHEGSVLQPIANSDLRPGMWASVRDYAKKSGLTLAEPTHVPNTRLAHLWIRKVSNLDVKNSLIERIYQAYLSDKKDIGNIMVLLEIANELGLSRGLLEEAAAHPESAPLEAFRKEAMDHQFPGMPGFQFSGKSYFGALSVEAWTPILKKETVCSTK